MPQSFSAAYMHLVFSTKDRRPFLADIELRAEMHAYLAATSAQLGCHALRVGGVDDHVHVLARLHKSIAQQDWVKELKRVSSRWAKERDESLKGFYWQTGYGIFSVSASNTERVIQYINRQPQHHRRISFQDEFRGLLRKHGFEWDERYVWD